jgi:hypothetical protein
VDGEGGGGDRARCALSASQEWFGIEWHVRWYYISDAVTMALSLLNVATSGFLVVATQGMFLRGPPNSVARCIAILIRFWPTVGRTLVLSVLGLLSTATASCWMKLEAALLQDELEEEDKERHNGTLPPEDPPLPAHNHSEAADLYDAPTDEYFAVAIVCTVVIVGVMIAATLKIRRLHRELDIAEHDLVCGDLRVSQALDPVHEQPEEQQPAAQRHCVDIMAEDQPIIAVSAR